MVQIPLLSSTLPVSVSWFSQYPITGQVYISENAGSDILCDASCLRRGYKTANTFTFYWSAGVKRSLATFSAMRHLLTLFILWANICSQKTCQRCCTKWLRTPSLFTTLFMVSLLCCRWRDEDDTGTQDRWYLSTCPVSSSSRHLQRNKATIITLPKLTLYRF